MLFINLLSVFYHEWVKYFVQCLICVNNQQIGLFLLNCCIYEHKVVHSILSLLMAAESVVISRFIPDIADLCHLSLSQVLLEVYHSLLMIFWRTSFLFHYFGLLFVLNFINLCSYFRFSFFLLHLGLFCPFSGFQRKNLRLLIWVCSSFLMQAFNVAIFSSQNCLSCTPRILICCIFVFT